MDERLFLYKVNPNYIKFLHEIDSKISVKYNGRPFVGVVTMISRVKYVLPLTSQTTAERKAAGKNKRSSMLTTFIKDSTGSEIANVLHNNMFPVTDEVIAKLEIDSETDTYESNEIRFIRKNRDKIIAKAQKVYELRISKPNDFLRKTCCDFLRLENFYKNFNAE